MVKSPRRATLALTTLYYKLKVVFMMDITAAHVSNFPVEEYLILSQQAHRFFSRIEIIVLLSLLPLYSLA